MSTDTDRWATDDKPHSDRSWTANDRWRTVDKWLMGEAFVNSHLEEFLHELCGRIGPRWAGTAGDLAAGSYIVGAFEQIGLTAPRSEEFKLDAWDYSSCRGRIVKDNRTVDLVPMIHCPPTEVRGRLVDVGFGMPHELTSRLDHLRGGIAVIAVADEPFTEPCPLPARLRALAAAGCVAAVAVEQRAGGHIETLRATDKRWNARAGDVLPHPLPSVQTHREDGARLRRAAGETMEIAVDSKAFTSACFNSVADLPGQSWPDETLILGSHQDTYMDSPGAVDNGSGLAVMLETMRLLAALENEFGISPGIGIRACAWSGEEQNHQGSAAYVRQHYGTENKPRLVVNLDELAAGPIKGMVLQFPNLQSLVQHTLDSLDEGLRCHVMPTLDHFNDGFSFARSAIPYAILWRWRFVGRHPDSDFRAESWDTVDKVRVRELKEYAAYLARMLIRLAQVAPDDWPDMPETEASVQARLEREIGQVARTM